MPLVFWVAAGGALGAALRHGVNEGATRLFGPGFPWATLLVNVSGSCIMGLLTGLMASRLPVSAEWRVFLTTGVLGGFTTFSAFSMDFAGLVARKLPGLAFGYAAGSVLLSLGAVFLGLALARALG